MSVFKEQILNEEQLTEQVDLLVESKLLTKISSEAKKLLKKGQAIFKRGIKKVVDKNTGKEITEDNPKEAK